MSELVIRFARRLTSWEPERPIEDIQALEFRTRTGDPDLRPSVYLVIDDERSVIQAYAEHAATPPFTPEKETIAIDAAGCAECLVATPGSKRFAFVRGAHREFELEDLPALLAFIGRLRDRVRALRARRVTKDRVYAYANERIVAGDVEWLAVAALAENKWLAALGKLVATE